MSEVTQEDLDNIKNQVSSLELRTDQINAYLECVDKTVQCSEEDDPLVFAFTSMQGDAAGFAAQQAALAAAMEAIDPLGVFFGGGSNLPAGADGTLNVNWNEFASFITAEKAYPAMGPVENEVDAGLAHVTKFSYLPNNKRYYTVSFGNNLVEFFIPNTGTDISNALVEPDGVANGSIQYDYMMDALMASKATWKVLVVASPLATTIDNGLVACPHGELVSDWGHPKSMGFDLVLQGGLNGIEHFRSNFLDLITFGASVNTTLDDPYGATVLQYGDFGGGGGGAFDNSFSNDFDVAEAGSPDPPLIKMFQGGDPMTDVNLFLGFVKLSVQRSNITVAFKNTSNTTWYQFQIKK